MQNVDLVKEACLLFETKLNLFEQYLSATQKMKAAFENNEETNPGMLISLRQDLIRKIDKIDMAIKRIPAATPDIHRTISLKYKELISGYIQKIKNIMDTVEPLDKILMVMFQQQNENIKTGLLNKRKVRQAFKGYGSYKQYSAKFLDTRR